MISTAFSGRHAAWPHASAAISESQRRDAHRNPNRAARIIVECHLCSSTGDMSRAPVPSSCSCRAVRMRFQQAFSTFIGSTLPDSPAYGITLNAGLIIMHAYGMPSGLRRAASRTGALRTARSGAQAARRACPAVRSSAPQARGPAKPCDRLERDEPLRGTATAPVTICASVARFASGRAPLSTRAQVARFLDRVRESTTTRAASRKHWTSASANCGRVLPTAHSRRHWASHSPRNTGSLPWRCSRPPPPHGARAASGVSTASTGTPSFADISRAKFSRFATVGCTPRRSHAIHRGQLSSCVRAWLPEPITRPRPDPAPALFARSRARRPGAQIVMICRRGARAARRLEAISKTT